MPDDATTPPFPPVPHGMDARERRTFAALAGLTSLSILLQGIFAGVFIEPGTHSGWLNAHNVNADIATALGIITAHHYSAIHDSPLNKAYREDFQAAYGKRPNYVSVGGYDGMHLIYEALKKTGGKTDGDTVIAAMKGLKWESPRGPVEIDPRTRDIVQNEYIRRVERVNGQLSNVEIETYPMVKDPVKEAKK